MTNAVGKNFRTTPGKGIDARGFQLLQRLCNRELGAFRQVRYLNHGESFQVHLRKALLQSGNEIEEILKRQIGMQAADDMKLGYCFTVAGSRGFKCFVEGHRVSPRRILFPSESAQPAGGYANIRRIDMAIDVEISLVAVHSFANVISQPTDCENIASAIQRYPISEVEALACKDFFMDRFKPSVVG